MRKRGRGEERDTTTHLIKIQFLLTLVVLLNLALAARCSWLRPAPNRAVISEVISCCSFTRMRAHGAQ